MARKIGEVLWLALQCAKQDRKSLIDAYRGDKAEEAVRDAMSDIKAFEKLQLKLFGTTRSELEAAILRMKPVDILRLIARKELLDSEEFLVDLHTDEPNQ